MCQLYRSTENFDIKPMIIYIGLVLSDIFLNKVSVKFLFCSVYNKNGIHVRLTCKAAMAF